MVRWKVRENIELRVGVCVCVCVFFFKQKTAYEIGTGDWSSDMCSSDLTPVLLLAILLIYKGLKGQSVSGSEDTDPLNA